MGAMVAAPATVRIFTLIRGPFQNLGLGKEVPYKIFIKDCIFVIPAMFTLGMGCWMIKSMYDYCITKSFAQTIDIVTPEFLFNENREKALKEWNGGKVEKLLGQLAFGFGATFVSVIMAATCCGLTPNYRVLLGHRDHDHARLAEVEIWGACGFACFAFFGQNLLTFLYPTFDDMEDISDNAQITAKERTKEKKQRKA